MRLKQGRTKGLPACKIGLVYKSGMARYIPQLSRIQNTQVNSIHLEKTRNEGREGGKEEEDESKATIQIRKIVTKLVYRRKCGNISST